MWWGQQSRSVDHEGLLWCSPHLSHGGQRPGTKAYFTFQQGFRLQVAWGLILAKTEIESYHTQSDNQNSARLTGRENTPLPVGRRLSKGAVVCRWTNRGERKSELYQISLGLFKTRYSTLHDKREELSSYTAGAGRVGSAVGRGVGVR